MKKFLNIKTIFFFVLIGMLNGRLFAQYDFSVSPTTGCYPLTVTITNLTTDTNAYYYWWNFNDGSPYLQDTLSLTFNHTFNNGGNYSITMDVYDISWNWLGWSYGSSGQISVQGSNNFFQTADSVCPGDAVQFCGDWQAFSWSWNFGDAASSSEQCPQHTYTTIGNYNVTLIQNGTCGSDTIVQQINVNTNIPADAQFWFWPNSNCPNSPVNFNTNSQTGAHFWDFGDGDTSQLAGNLQHSFAAAGNYSVQHIWTNSCNMTDTFIDIVSIDTTISIPFGVNINVNPNEICPGEQINANASNGYLNYIWSFDDGSPSDTTAENWIFHAYGDTGEYILSVRFFNGCGRDTTLYDTVVVSNNIGFDSTANYNLDINSPQPSCPGDNISFNAVWGYHNYFYDYGDGNTEARGEQNYANHTYPNIGNYPVSVTFQNNCSIDTTLYDTVVISNTAGFGGNVNINVYPNPPVVCPGQEVRLETWGYKKYIWLFGDGSPALTTNYGNIGHSYSDTGNYNVTITVFNNCGSDTTVYGMVMVDDSVGFPNDPSFKINSDASVACPGASVGFYIPGDYANFNWNFGDGSPVVSTVVNSYSHSFADTGSYLVTVLVTNHCGLDTTLSKTVQVVNDAGFPSYLNFSAGPSPACPGQSLNFSTNKGYAAYRWNFGDGNIDSLKNTEWINHIYSAGGVFAATVTITNYCGQDTTLSKTVTIDTNLRIPSNTTMSINTSPACPGQEISFGTNSNDKSFIWNFGDGSPLVYKNWSNADHAYQDTGNYIVSLNITNYCNNDTTIYDSVVIGNNVGFISSLNLWINPQTSCPSDEVNFSASNGYKTYMWDFGDSTTAVGSSWADHIYDSAGTYNVQVTIINQCGIDTTISSLAVVDINTDLPYWLSLNSNTSEVCPGENVDFDVNGSGMDLYIWDFGDGDSSITTGREISHAFDSAGNYVVSVEVFNGCGKSKKIYQTINVTPNAPVASIDIMVQPSTGCPGDAIQLVAENGSTSYVYVWDYGDGITDTITGNATTHNYSDTGTYTINVTAINSCGNSATFKTSVIIGDSIKPNFDSGDGWGIPNGSDVGGCPGDAILFYFWGTGDNFWDFGDGYTDVATEPLVVENGFVVTIIQHAYSDTGIYKVKFSQTNGCGFTYIDSMNVKVGNNLLVNGDFLIQEPTQAGGYTTCSPIGFLAIGGETYTWNFGDGDSLTTINPTTTHTYSSPGNYSVSVRITNGCGNSTTLSSSITVFDVGSAVVNTTIVSDIICHDGENGGISASVAGGQPPFTYLWNDASAQTASVAVNLSSGLYMVTVTDKVGCTGVGTGTLVNPPQLQLSTSSTASACAGNTGTATVTVANFGIPPYTYLWSDNFTGQTATGLSFGTYTVIVTDSSGCTNSAFQSVSDSGSASVVVDSIAHTSCAGASDASVFVAVSGGTPPYTYNWSNGATVQNPQNLSAGNYSLTVSDVSGCISASYTQVTQPYAISLSFTTIGTGCGTSNGSATVDASGGTGSFTYLWDNNTNDQTTQTATGLPYGTFDITVTDENNCTVIGTASVNNTNAPTITAVITNVSCFGGNNGSIIQTVTGGTTPYTYTWSTGGATKNKNNLSSGAYTCFISDHNGCVTIRNYSVTQPAVLTAAATSASSATCGNADGGVTVNVTGGTSPYFYSWTGGGTASAVSGLTGGNYNVTVTDNKACSATSSAAVPVYAAPQPICIVTVDSATKKNLLSWEKTPGLSTASFIIYKEVSLNVYNAIDTVPYDSTSFYIDYASDPKTKSERYKIATYDSCGNTSAQSTAHKTIHLVVNVGINDERNLVLTDGYEGFTFGKYRIWRGTAVNNIALIDSIVSNATTYSDWDTLTGVDSLFYITEVVHPQGGCTSTLKLKTYNSSKSNTASLQAPTAAVSATVTATGVTCNGGNDGTATCTAAGGTPPYTYAWNDPMSQATPTATGLIAGNYQVTVSDSKGDTNLVNLTVTQPVQVTVSSSTVSATCNNGDGTATAVASGGNGGFNYSWNNGQSGAMATGMVAGNYSVTATDASGCTGVTTVTISSVNTPISLVSAANAVTCFGGNNGTATVIPTSGISPYAYQWNSSANNQTNATATGLAAGNYNVTVTDSKGCYNSQNITVTEPAQITLSVSTINSSCGNADGSATVTASGGTGGFSYSWSNGQSASGATALAAGNYTVTVKDANNCSATTIASVSDANAPALSASSTAVTCNGDGDGTASIAAAGGTPPYTYQWDAVTGNQTDATATGLSGGTFSVSVYDNAGCLATQSVAVNEPAAVLVTALVTDATSPGNNDGAIDLTITGGTGAYTFAWSNGEITEDISNLSSGTYSVTITDANNCQAVYSDSVKLIVGEFYNSPFTTHRILIYPNPNSGTFNIEIRNVKYKTQNVKCKIQNILGEEVFQSAIFNSQSAMFLDIPEGIYALRVEAEGEIVGIVRLIVEK